jgi:exodeoxyribonuclease-3
MERVFEQLSPDVICLQETKAHQEQLAREICDRGEWFFSSAKKRGYSGVATVVHSARFLPSAVRYGVECARFDEEGRFVITEHGPLTLYNVYFPSGTSGEVRQTFKYEFLECFLEHLQALPPERRARLVVTGDFNICHREIDIHHPEVATQRRLTGFLPEERRWMDRFCESGFSDTFRLLHGDEPRRYTWWSFRAGSRAKNLGWRIDYFFVSKELEKRVRRAEIYEHMNGSDHCPILLELADEDE